MHSSAMQRPALRLCTRRVSHTLRAPACRVVSRVQRGALVPRAAAQRVEPTEAAGARRAAALSFSAAAVLPQVLLQPPADAAQLVGDVAEGGPGSAAKTLVAVLLILFIIAQGPKGEGMINSLNESRMLGNFTQTKNFVTVGTWALVGLFLGLSAIVALKQ